MTPVEFLTAMYAERHAAALAALAEPDDDGRWCTSSASPATDQCRVEGRGIIIYDEGGHTAQQATFIAGNDPAYVLADVGAKRRILELHGDQHDCPDWRRASEYPYVGCSTVLLLCQPFAERPDYDPKWAV